MADDIASKVATAKGVLAHAKATFPSAKAAAPKPAPIAAGKAPVQTGGKAANAQEATRTLNTMVPNAPGGGPGPSTGVMGTLHSGTDRVEKTGLYKLEEGEAVVAKENNPANKPAAAEGRNSEYRKVYIARRQARDGGGNTPAKGEKHDQKRATKGQPEGAGRTPSMKE